MPQEIDISQVSSFFEEHNFTVEQVRKPWRHIVGKLEKDGEPFYFKMAAWPEINPKTQNEVAWNNLVNSRELILPLKVPQIIETGTWQDCFWYISEFVDGQELAQPFDSTHIDTLEAQLSTIANCMETIITFNSPVLLPKDQENEGKDIRDVFQEKLTLWKKDITTTDIEPLWHFLHERIDSFTLAPIHGDFVPWHILHSENGTYLIDGEHAAMKGIKFYDVAYFYQRIYTKLKRPEIAHKFLKIFQETHKFTQQDVQCFEAILAQRVIGGYLDAQSDNITSVELQHELGKKLLTAELL